MTTTTVNLAIILSFTWGIAAILHGKYEQAALAFWALGAWACLADEIQDDGDGSND